MSILTSFLQIWMVFYYELNAHLLTFWGLYRLLLDLKTFGYLLKSESIKQMEEKLNFQVPAEGLQLVIFLHTQY